MERIVCGNCDKTFSRMDVMKRHHASTHGRMDSLERHSPKTSIEKQSHQSPIQSPIQLHMSQPLSPMAQQSNIKSQTSGRIPTRPAPVYSGMPMGMDDDDILFMHPFTMCISGPTGCGKTFIERRFYANSW